MLAYMPGWFKTPERLINAWHRCVSRGVFGSCRCQINQVPRETESSRSICAGHAWLATPLWFWRLFSSHTWWSGFPLDEVTKATPNIHSGSPHQNTHKHTGKRSTCSHGPVRCSRCNHPHLLTDNNENNNSSSSGGSYSSAGQSSVVTHPSCLRCIVQ